MQTTPLSPEDPAALGGFELQARIGHGGMGQVFLGESPAGEPAAVKVIKPSVVDPETRQRFAGEIEVLKTLWGTRTAALMGADAEAEQPWLATEYVEGPDLGKHVKAHGPMPSLLVAALGAILAETLETVHAQGLLHRDLKPANVLLGPNGPKIIDFGLAVFAEAHVSLTATNEVVGTPVCMAPEQAANIKPLGSAVDVYSLGAVLLFAAAGHYPYQAPSPYLVFQQINDPHVAADLSGAPEELAPLLTDMLAQSPEQRPPWQDVVTRCRAVVKAQGMTIAQARRRLTQHTSAMMQRDPSDAVASGERTRSTVPFADLRTAKSPTPATQDEGEGHAPGEATAHTPPPVPTVLDAPDAGTSTDSPPQRETEPSSSSQRSRRTVLHSAEARKTAEQLRRAYAAGATF